MGALIDVLPSRTGRGRILNTPLANGLEQAKNRTPQKTRESILNVWDLRVQLGANDEPVPFHPTEMLIEHLLRDRPHSSFEFPNPNRAILKLAEDRDSPFPLNQCDRALDQRLV